MKHLERGLFGQNSFWRYLGVTLFLFIVVSLVRAVPLAGVLIYKMISTGVYPDTSNVNALDFSIYGISKNTGLALMLLMYVAMFFVFKWIVKPIHGRTLNETVNGRNFIRKNRIWTGMLVWGACLAVSFIVGLVTSPQDYELQFNLAKFIPLLLIVILILPFQTSFEEIFFRGYLSQGVAKWTKNRWWVLVIISLTFGLMHAANPEVKEFGFWAAMPQYILMGFLLGFVSILDDGIEIALGMHFINNAFGSLLTTHSASALQTDAIYEIKNIDATTDLLSLIVMIGITIAILQRIYKWDFRVMNRRIEPELPPVPQYIPPAIPNEGTLQNP